MTVTRPRTPAPSPDSSVRAPGLSMTGHEQNIMGQKEGDKFFDVFSKRRHGCVPSPVGRGWLRSSRVRGSGPSQTQHPLIRSLRDHLLPPCRLLGEKGCSAWISSGLFPSRRGFRACKAAWTSTASRCVRPARGLNRASLLRWTHASLAPLLSRRRCEYGTGQKVLDKFVDVPR